MRIIRYGAGDHTPCVLLLGYFDGVHVGHRALIAFARDKAREFGCAVGIMTFRGGKNGAQVYTLQERCSVFAELGVGFVYLADFDAAFRATEGRAFLEQACVDLAVRGFVCGEDYTFGRGAACTAQDLCAFAKERGIAAFVRPLLCCGGEKAASSRAKALLDAGDAAALAELLGERYRIAGRVGTEGRQVGRRMGFPTANIHLPPEKYPLRTGVYAVTVRTEHGTYRGIANYGARPTFGDDRVVLEVYADGYRGDLYGQEVTVFFDARLRDVIKFENAAALAAQLKKDLESIR